MSQRLTCTVLVFAMLGCTSGGGDEPIVLDATFALAAVKLLVPRPEAEVEQIFDAGLVLAAVGVLVLHADPLVPAKIPPALWTEISHYGLVQVFWTAAVLRTLFGTSEVAQTGFSPSFPPGVGPNGFTVKAGMPLAMPQDDYFIVHFSCKGLVPVVSADSAVIYQYAVVFDVDGLATTNYTTADNDFFNDSDRWYVMDYTDATGWRLTVWDASGTVPVEIASAARVILTANAMLLVVPASEFTVPNPAYRVTTFCHTGDRGANPPHSWSGDLHPPVDDGLEPFPG